MVAHEGSAGVVVRPVAHFLEYVRLLLEEDEELAINRWSGAFLRAHAAIFEKLGLALLRGIKSGERVLSARSRAAIAHCQALLAALLDDGDAAEAGYRRSLALLGEAGDDLRTGWVLNDLGTLQYARGEWADAVGSYRQALDVLLAAETSESSEAMVRNNLGLALLGLGDEAEGAEQLERAGELYGRAGQPQGQAHVQVNLGQLYHRQGEVERALRAYEHALQVLRAFRDRRVEVEVLNSLGVLYRYRGELERALTYHHDSLALAQELEELGGQAQALANLGTIYQLQDRLAEARHCYEESRALAEMIGDRHGQAQSWGNLGHLLSLESRSQEALAAYERGLALAREVNDAAGEAVALANVAGAHRDLGQHEQAEALYLEAIALARRLGNLRLQDKTLGALGTLRAIQQRWDEAEALYQQALALQRQRGDANAEVETLYKLARLAHERGDHDQVLAIVEPAWNLAQAYGYGRWLIMIAWLLGDAAFAVRDPAAFNYYGMAAVVAREYEDERRLTITLAILGDWIADLVKRDNREEALEVCQHLLDLWQNEDWRELAGPGIAYVERMATAIRSREPLPVQFD